jgi:hypothetical protein
VIDLRQFFALDERFGTGLLTLDWVFSPSYRKSVSSSKEASPRMALKDHAPLKTSF